MPTATETSACKIKTMEVVKPVIEFSETETRCLKLKFGRYNASQVDPKYIKAAILEEKYDVVRVKTCASDELVSINLEQTGFPFYFNGGVRRYQVNCFEAPLPPFTSPDISFELFTGQKMDIFEQIMFDSMGDNPLGYYRSPLLSKKITRDMEVKCLFEYYSHYNNNSRFSDNYLWFMKVGEDYAGIIALYVYRDKSMVDSTLAGFMKNYQSKGLFPNILRHIRNFCREQNLTYFCCGARLENLHSQWAFEKDFMKGTGVDYIFHVVPLLGFK